MPKVSVIVPVYNTEKYLSRCIDSILAQTYTDFELILVNDGSTDNSGKICDEYAQKDKRIVVIHKENGGVSSARNKGIEKAKGEWIAFVDSDDYISETYLSDFPKNDENDMEICGIVSFNGQSFISNQQGVKYSDKNLSLFYEDLFSYRANTSPWAKIIKKEILKKNHICFDTNMRLAEDTLFILNLLNFINTIQIIPNTNYYYNSPDNCIKKYNISIEQIKYNLERLINSATKLALKRPFNLNKITEPIKYFQFCCFNNLLTYADKKERLKLLNRYRKYSLFRYRPQMNFKESVYLWLQTRFPHFLN